MKSTIMAPLYMRDLKLGEAFLKSRSKYFNDDNIYLCFSDEEEIKVFQSSDKQYRGLVCKEKLDIKKKPISQKKIWAVNEIFNTTDYDLIGVVDIDTEFIQFADIDILFKQRIQQKKIYASKVINHGINEKVGRDAAQRFFSTTDVKKLQQLTDDFRLYFWFNDIPIYEREYWKPWLTYIDYHNKKELLLYTTFDYILYMYYLLLENIWQIEEIEIDGIKPKTLDSGSFIESQRKLDSDYFQKVFHKYNPMWIMDPIPNQKNVFMRLHINQK